LVDQDYVLRELAKKDKVFLQFLSSNKKQPPQPSINMQSSAFKSGVHSNQKSPQGPQKQVLLKAYEVISYDESQTEMVIFR
jgi:hypothetical protein